MRRAITGFHQDAEGDWVAELECGHTQHVRHRPPFQNRPWVTSEAGRTGRLGTQLECPLCGAGPRGTAGGLDGSRGCRHYPGTVDP